MKASELIEALQAAISEHGDQRVFALCPDETWAEVEGVDQFDVDEYRGISVPEFISYPKAGEFRI